MGYLYDAEAYVFNGDIICSNCYDDLGPKEQAAATPIFNTEELEEIAGEGVWCAYSTQEEKLTGNAHVIRERTDEYIFTSQAWFHDIAGVLIEGLETVDEPEWKAQGKYPYWRYTGWSTWSCRCIECAIKHSDIEDFVPRITLDRIAQAVEQAKELGYDTYPLQCDECEKPLEDAYYTFFQKEIKQGYSNYWEVDLDSKLVLL